MGFDRRMVIPRGMIRLPMQARDKEVQVNFIVVEAYSLHSYLGQTLAPCYRCGVFNLTSESQVSHSRKSGGVGW